MKKRISHIIFFLLSGAMAKGQLPGNFFLRDPLSPQQAYLVRNPYQEHPGIQPAAYGLESSLIVLSDSLRIADPYTSGWKVRPLANISVGYEGKNRSGSVGSLLAGAVAEWHKEEKWDADIGYLLAVQKPPFYIEKIADSLRVLPGSGYAVKDGKGMYHTHIPFGHVGYQAGKYFHFELGRGKHFWGDGYRSLILSDFSAPFPYFRITTKIWHIKYTNLFGRMDDISQKRHYADARTKYVALHGLSWNISKKWNMSLFEMVVWQDRDSLSRRNLDLHYFNPLIFYRPVEFAQGSSDNVLIGFGQKIRATHTIEVYMQILLDEFLLDEVLKKRGWWGNKFGGQIGIKFFDLFTPGFAFQTEFSAVRPFTYTHASSIQAWGQMNQALAHPMGANFFEWPFLFRYDAQSWTFKEKFVWAAFGRDKDGHNQGGNIFRSYRKTYRTFGNTLLQGTRNSFVFHEFEVSHPLPKWNGWEAFATHTIRIQKNEKFTGKDQFLCVGIRVRGLLNTTTDF